jgi:hypothetical protein
MLAAFAADVFPAPELHQVERAYAGLRDASHAFREGVTRLFFDVHPQLRDLIRKFGVF